MTTWSQAFAAQAASDLEAYEFLVQSALPVNHRLHHLQMWLEKLCKAYIWMPSASPDMELLEERHNVIAKVLPRLIHEHWRRIGFENKPDMGPVRDLCREIDLLHPQIKDAQRRPDNAEYPWLAGSGSIEVPAQWQFPVARRLYSYPGKLLLKAAIQLTRSPALFA